MCTVNTTLEVWTWEVQVSGYHDSNSSLERIKWIVQMIQLEKNSTKQRAIQQAFKWNKSQFSPTADAQRTVNWALWFYFTLSFPFFYPLISSLPLLYAHCSNLSFCIYNCKDFFVRLCLCFLACLSYSFILQAYTLGFPLALSAAWIPQGIYWTGCQNRSMTHADSGTPITYCTVDFVTVHSHS